MSQSDPAVPPPAFSVLDELRRAVAHAEAAADLGPLFASGDGAAGVARLEAAMAPLAGLAAQAGQLPADVTAALTRLRDRIEATAAAGDGWLANTAAAQRVRRAYGLPP